MYPKSTVYFSGSAKLPGTIPSERVHEIVNVGVMVDTNTGEVIDMSSTLFSNGAQRFLEYLIIGQNIGTLEGREELLKEINEKYFGDSQKAIMMSLKTIYERYQKYIECKNKV